MFRAAWTYLGYLLHYTLTLALSLGSLLLLSGPLGLALVYAILEGRPFRPFWVGGRRGLGYTLATVLSLLLAFGLLFGLLFALASLYALGLLLRGTPLGELEGRLVQAVGWADTPLGTSLLSFLLGFPPTLFLAALGVSYRRGTGLPEALKILFRAELLPYAVLFLILVALPVLWKAFWPGFYLEAGAWLFQLAYGTGYWIHLVRGLDRAALRAGVGAP